MPISIPAPNPLLHTHHPQIHTESHSSPPRLLPHHPPPALKSRYQHPSFTLSPRFPSQNSKTTNSNQNLHFPSTIFQRCGESNHLESVGGIGQGGRGESLVNRG